MLAFMLSFIYNKYMSYIKSDQINELAAALAKAQGEFPSIPKRKTAKVPMKAGGSYSYNYADLSDVLSAILPVLSKHGLSITQPPASNSLTTLLMHSSGQFLGSEMAIGEVASIQALGSEITYLRRYAACAIVGVHGDEDEDGNLTDGKHASIEPKANFKEIVRPNNLNAPGQTAPHVSYEEFAATVSIKPVDALKSNPSQRKHERNDEIVETAKKFNWKPAEVKAYIKKTWAVDLAAELTNIQVTDLLRTITLYRPDEIT